MKRREFLQIAGSMIVGAAVGGNAPNPVVFPTRPYNDPLPVMPEQLAYRQGQQAIVDWMEGFDISIYIPKVETPDWHVVFCSFDSSGFTIDFS